MALPDIAPALDIAVGTKLAMQLPGLDAKLMSSLVGFVKGRYLVIQLPGAPEVGREQLYPHLYADNAATVRYLHLGKVMGFACKIIKYQIAPFPIVFLTYPLRVETFNLRKHERIACLFPVTARLGETSREGMITDLSAEGCGLMLQIDPDLRLALKIDARLELDCPMFAVAESPTLPGVVMRLTTGEGRVEVGVKFKDPHPEAKRKILSYVNNARHYLHF